MKLTFALKDLLAYHKENSDSETYHELDREIHRLIQVYLEKLEIIPAGADRARQIHHWIDEQNKAHSHLSTSCYKGCGACCHLEVEITSDDAARLAQAISERQVEINDKILKIQAARERQDPAWKKKVHPENRCVFLGKDNACQVYEYRPSICRKHSVTSQPSECSDENGRPLPRLIPMNEVILSAAINLPENTFGSLSKMLLAVFEKQDLQKIGKLHFIEENPLSASAERELEPKPPENEL